MDLSRGFAHGTGLDERSRYCAPGRMEWIGTARAPSPRRPASHGEATMLDSSHSNSASSVSHKNRHSQADSVGSVGGD